MLLGAAATVAAVRAAGATSMPMAMRDTKEQDATMPLKMAMKCCQLLQCCGAAARKGSRPLHPKYYD
jgi:hypothetical protein